MIPYRDLGKTIWIFTVAIMTIGLLTLYSASYNNVRVDRGVFYDQLFCAVLGLFLMYFLSRIDYRKFYEVAYVLYGINLVILIFVLAAGRNALGATRWISIGFLSFQPSELTKLVMILMLGRYFSQRRPRLSFSLQSSLNGLVS